MRVRRANPECAHCDCGASSWAATTQGRVAIVDRADSDLLQKFVWCNAKNGRTSYVVSEACKLEVGSRLLHHAVAARLGMGPRIDHANGHGSDCRRINLRDATDQENCRNRRKALRATSKFKGVTYKARDLLWEVRIVVDYKSIALGTFKDETIAARAYDAAARKYFGAFARPNFQEAVS